MKALEILNNGLNFMKEGISHNQKIKQEVNQVIELYNEAISELEEIKKEDEYIKQKMKESLSMGNKAQSLVFVEVYQIIKNRESK